MHVDLFPVILLYVCLSMYRTRTHMKQEENKVSLGTSNHSSYSFWCQSEFVDFMSWMSCLIWFKSLVYTRIAITAYVAGQLDYFSHLTLQPQHTLNSLKIANGKWHFLIHPCFGKLAIYAGIYRIASKISSYVHLYIIGRNCGTTLWEIGNEQPKDKRWPTCLKMTTSLQRKFHSLKLLLSLFHSWLSAMWSSGSMELAMIQLRSSSSFSALQVPCSALLLHSLQ